MKWINFERYFCPLTENKIIEYRRITTPFVFFRLKSKEYTYFENENVSAWFVIIKMSGWKEKGKIVFNNDDLIEKLNHVRKLHKEIRQR